MANTNLQSVETQEETKTTTLAQVREALNKSFRERSALVDGMLVSLLSKEMLFLLGPPGTAKSAIVEALCKAVGGSYFNWLLTKFTTPDELFGPYSLQSLQKDKYVRVTTNKLPTADIAFVDEIFKGSSAVLNTLLSIINERKFFNGDGPTKVPLQVLFGASNEVPQSDELAALYDRFALRFKVDRLQKDASAEALFKGELNSEIPSLTLAQLAEEQAKAAAVTVPTAIVKILVELRKSVENEGIYVSDRKWVQSVRIVKANAHLNGHTEVTETDLEILENVLWTDPAQQRSVKKMISKLANPVGEKIMRIQDIVYEIKGKLDKGEMQATEAVNKLKTAIKELEKLSGGNPESNPKLKAALAEAREIQKGILVDHLGFES